MTIRQMREATGLSQSDFAAKFHIKVDTLRMWEYNINKPTSYTTYMIEHILRLEGYNLGEGKDAK